MRLVSRVPCLIGLGFGAAIAAPTGYTYTVRVSTDHGHTLIAHAWAKGDKLRVKLESGERDEGAMRRVSYVLGQDGGRTLFFVDSVDRIYFPFGTGPGAVRPGAIASPTEQVSNIQVQAEALGAGGPVLGYATTRYRMTQDYSRSTDPSGAGRVRVHAVLEYWGTRDLPAYINPEFLSGLFAARALAGGDELSRRAAAAMERLNPGAVLKYVGTTTTSDAGGNITKTVGTAEITELKATSVDDAMLDLPQGSQDGVPYADGEAVKPARLHART